MEKHAHPPSMVFCAIYPTLTHFTKFLVSNLHITSTQDAANNSTKGGYPVTVTADKNFRLCEEASFIKIKSQNANISAQVMIINAQM